MAVRKLNERRLEKIWGRRDLPEMFGGTYGGEEPLGEIWFEHSDAAEVELLVKYLFTSEKLSIQVHPDDEAAIRAGHKHGKDEAWIVLEAETGATIGIGLRERASREQCAGRHGTVPSRIWSTGALRPQATSSTRPPGRCTRSGRD